MSVSVDSVRSSSTGGASSTEKTSLTASDFLKLFVTQLQNQDFNDPMDNGEMMNQITQLSNMQMMQEMAEYSKSGYAISLVGKTVTATRYENGALDTTTGVVSKISLVDSGYVVYVNGKEYSLAGIMEIQNGSDAGSPIDVSSLPVTLTSVTDHSATVRWSVPTQDEAVADSLKYTVYYSQGGPFDTVGEVEKGTGFGAAGQAGLTGAAVTGLEAAQTYYINVLIEDANGNRYVYKPAAITTNQ